MATTQHQYDNVDFLKYYHDGHGHVICVPYSEDNLHKMAFDLGLKQSRFNKNHYKITKQEAKNLETYKGLKTLDKSTIVEIIRNPGYSHIYLDGSLPPEKGNSVPHNQVLPEAEVLTYNGFNDR